MGRSLNMTDDKVLTVSMTGAMHRALRVRAAEEDTSPPRLVKSLIREGLAARGISLQEPGQEVTDGAWDGDGTA